MNVSRHISIDDEHFDKMKPFIEKHNGNLNNALREMLNLADKYSSRMNFSALDKSFFNWMLDEIDGILVPDNVLDEFLNNENSMKKLEDNFRRKITELGWDIEFILKYDRDMFPSSVSIEMRGNPQEIKLFTCILSQFLVKNSLDNVPLEVKFAVNFSDCIKVELCMSSRQKAMGSLVTFFGGEDEIFKIIRSRPAFWKAIINRHISSNYNMVTVHRNFFEDVLTGKVPTGEIIIETMGRKPIREIPLNEILPLIKKVYESCRVVDRIDIDKDTLIVFHSYRNPEAIEKLKKIFILLLEANGHFYQVKSSANMIMLLHRPDVGVKINEIVDNLKTSGNMVDQELIMFMTFLKGLKEIPDMPISLTALGRRIGRSLMIEYEKENNITKWELKNFQKALQVIDSRLHRVSEWKLEGNNLLYTIRKCNIVSEVNSFDTYVCHTARETFKGALDYAFGNKAELKIKKLLSHGDSFCEVAIRIP